MGNPLLAEAKRHRDAGLCPVPVVGKVPVLKGWQNQPCLPSDADLESWLSLTDREGRRVDGFGIATGAISGGLVCLDFDTKNDPTGTMVKEFFASVKEMGGERVVDACVGQKTPSGGYHLIFRCPDITDGNQVFARSEVTRKAVIETRGQGGQFVAYPSPGYAVVRGGLESVQTLSLADAELLFSAARSVDRSSPPSQPLASPPPVFRSSGDLTPIDDYNQRATVDMMQGEVESVGFVQVRQVGQNIHYRRPGKTGRDTSATLHVEKKLFYVFTTSTELEANKAYSPAALLCYLQHHGDWSETARALRQAGYGSKSKPTPEPVALTQHALCGDLEERILGLYNNGLKKGVSPGWENLSKLYQVVKGQLNIVTGIPSHGKSEFTDALMVNLAVNHKWRFVVYSPENYPVELHARKLMEKLIGKNMFGADRFTREQLADGTKWVLDHFTFLDGVDESVTLDSIFGAVEEQRRIRPVDGVIIDPWNELESSRPEKMSETDFIGLCLKRARMFARKHEIAFWIVAHPFKMKKDPKTGDYPVPTLYDISGSAHWYNKADNGLVVYRDFAQNVTRIHVEKIKFKYYGKKGEVDMKYDPLSGRLHEMNNSDHFRPENIQAQNHQQPQERYK